MARIFVAEDDASACEQIKDLLECARHVVETANSGTDALEFLRSYHFDLVILDWNMPGFSGVDVCRAYRSTGGVSPVLMLTARSDVSEKEIGFDAGADDYLTKPFELREFMARVKALLRRPPTFSGNSLQLGKLSLDGNTREVSYDGTLLRLLPLEFALLEFFMRHPGSPFSAEALMERVWPSDAEPSPETVRTYIKTLRQKLKEQSGNSCISTVYGVGYKLDPKGIPDEDDC